MKKKEIVFCQSVTGHYLEYIHHLYMGRVENNTETVFVIPATFEKQKALFEWPEANHISFDLIEIDIWSVGWLPRIYRLSKLLVNAVKRNKIVQNLAKCENLQSRGLSANSGCRGNFD